MNDSQIFGLFLAVFGACIVAASRGAFWWWSNAWRISETASETWIAMLMGPRLVNTFYLLVGLACIISGAIFLLGIL